MGFSGVYLRVCSTSKIDEVFATWGLCSSAPMKTHVFSSRSGLHDAARRNYNHTPFLFLLMNILKIRISGVPVSVGTCYVCSQRAQHIPLCPHLLSWSGLCFQMKPHLNSAFSP